MTMPVVPRIESPPTIPRRGFQVRSARRSPSRTPISTLRSPRAPCAAATSATVLRIIRRGTGLIAGSPTATGRPGRVTVPTPRPARNVTPVPGAPSRTVATTSARWVTSGSSPASLTMPRAGEPGARLLRREREGGPLPLRERDRHRVRKLPGEQRRVRGPGRGGGTGAGGPPAAQSLFPGAATCRDCRDSVRRRSLGPRALAGKLNAGGEAKPLSPREPATVRGSALAVAEGTSRMDSRFRGNDEKGVCLGLRHSRESGNPRKGNELRVVPCKRGLIFMTRFLRPKRLRGRPVPMSLVRRWEEFPDRGQHARE